jgi:multiple sugar transport system substrate-binding protein
MIGSTRGRGTAVTTRAVNRRQVLAGGLGIGAAVGLSSCAGLTSKAGDTAPSTAASGGSAGPAELTFVNWSGDAEKAAFDAVITKFQQANPGITIKTDTVPYASVQTNLDTRFQAGNPPDLFRVSYIDMGQYTSQDVLLDVTAAFDANAFEPGLYQAVVADGKAYGAPHQIDTTAILYRKDAFEAAGLTAPTTLDEAWTWEQFTEAANKLKGVAKSGQSAFIYDWQSAGAYRWLTWLFEAGGALLGPDLKSAAIDSDAGRKAVDFTKGFFDNGWVAKNTSVKSTTYPDSAFISGTVAMAFAGSFLVPAVDDGVKKKFEYGAMPQPRDVAASTDLGGNAVVAPKDGKNTEAATKFLQYLVSEEAMKTYCEATNQLPTLKSLTSSQLEFDIRPDLMQPFVQQATTLTPEQVSQVTVPQFADLNLALQNELEKAFLGGRSAADTTAALAAAVQKAVQ